VASVTRTAQVELRSARVSSGSPCRLLRCLRRGEPFLKREPFVPVHTRLGQRSVALEVVVWEAAPARGEEESRLSRHRDRVNGVGTHTAGKERTRCGWRLRQCITATWQDGRELVRLAGEKTGASLRFWVFPDYEGWKFG